MLLAACGAGGGDPTAKAEDLIACMVDGATVFARVCALERSISDAGALMLVVRHPSGAFRRMTVPKDGRGVSAADGAAPAEITPVDDQWVDVTLAGDRYRLPVAMKP
ncbi:hypothetical protein [Sphingobium boeckii]|uniref:Uncharacterized protein n=1 Tax=Sphingobium boeckii TaxID=1082345 RepID=A0A7W9AK35_9SPHN|nr:hypothetical protein [Sphingobium boeckii]MBB5687130.1 hypothetical protein [Sphingobium boeckii]